MCSLMRVVLSLHLSSHPLWRQDNSSSIRVVLPSWWQGICSLVRVVLPSWWQGICSPIRVILPSWWQDICSPIRVVFPSWWQGICSPIRVVSSASCGCLLLSPLWCPSSIMALYLLPHVGCPRYPAGTSFHSPISPTEFGETATERNKNIEVMCRRRS